VELYLGWFDAQEDDPMIKRPTWILLIILLLVVVAYFVEKSRGPGTSSTATPSTTGTNFLISSGDGALQVIRIIDAARHKRNMGCHTANNGDC
jgi:hypothetical protein